MEITSMTMDELERAAYLDPADAPLQRAYAERCREEVRHLQDEVARLERNVTELEEWQAEHGE